MAHVELPQEELDPIVEAIQEAFKPLTKAMPLIAKIPEEIKRLADNMSEDLSSGIPEKIDNAVEKITQDEAEMQLREALSEAEREALQELVDQLKLLRENGIPAEIKDGKVVKLTEEEIKITQQSYITTVKTLENLEKQKMMMARAGFQAEQFDKARAVADPFTKNTRRWIALMCVFAIIVLPKLVFLISPETPIYVGYTEATSVGWWIFASSAEMTTWKPLGGLVITPLDTHVVSSIIGLYFGGSLVRR